jgi:hypothetical protein
MPRIAGISGLRNAGTRDHECATVLIRLANIVVGSARNPASQDTTCDEHQYHH